MDKDVKKDVKSALFKALDELKIKLHPMGRGIPVENPADAKIKISFPDDMLEVIKNLTEEVERLTKIVEQLTKELDDLKTKNKDNKNS